MGVNGYGVQAGKSVDYLDDVYSKFHPTIFCSRYSMALALVIHDSIIRYILIAEYLYVYLNPFWQLED